MMKTIWKYPIRIEEKFSINLPNGAKPLCVGVDNNNTPCIWAEVNTNNKYVKKTFYGYTTGQDMKRSGKYIGTLFLYESSFIFHIYEK